MPAFNPDTDANYQALVYARGIVKGKDLVTWEFAMLQYFASLCTSSSTLVTNSGTRTAPNGSIKAAIDAANSVSGSGNRGF